MERRNNILGFIIYALVALILLLCGWWPAALILLLIYGLVLLMYKHNKKAQWLIDGDPSDKATLDEIIAQYGQPTDVVIIDPSRANEPLGTILLFSTLIAVNGRKSLKINKVTLCIWIFGWRKLSLHHVRTQETPQIRCL